MLKVLINEFKTYIDEIYELKILFAVLSSHLSNLQFKVTSLFVVKLYGNFSFFFFFFFLIFGGFKLYSSFLRICILKYSSIK